MTTPPDTLLVLGATGRVGQLLRRVWQARPPALRVIYQSREARPGHQRFVPSDDPACFGPVDAVLSLWGVTSGDEQALDHNRVLALEACRIAEACGATRVLHASSIAVYPAHDSPMSEDLPPAPTNAYGLAKWRMEQAVADRPGVQCCLRIGSVAGAESLAAACDRGTRPVLDRFASGKGPARSYIAPSDLAHVIEGLSQLAPSRLPPVLNVGARTPCRMEELLRAAEIGFDWRPATTTAREKAILQTALLHSLVKLPNTSASPTHIAQDWLRWRTLP